MAISKKTISIVGLRGIYTRKAIDQKQPYESEACAGGFFDLAGAFVKRKGGEKFNLTPFASPIKSFYDFAYSNGSNQKTIVSSGTNLYTLTSSASTSIKSGLTSGLIFDYEKFFKVSDYVFITNGTDTPLKYNGSAVTNASIVTPATNPSASATAGGSLTVAAYKVAVTFVRDSGSGDVQESNPTSAVDVSTSGGNLTISMTSIPVSSDSQVNKRYIYLTNPDGAILYYAGFINDNTTTTYSISAMPTLGLELEYDHDPMPNLKYIEIFNNRLVGAGNSTYPTRFYWSKLNNPWYWPQGEQDQERLNYIDFGNEPITAVKSYYDAVLIFTINGLYIFTGSDETNFRIDKVKTDQFVGCVSNEACVIQDNMCYFMSRDGVYRTNGIYVEDLTDPISGFFNSTTPLPYELQDYRVNLNALSSCNIAIDKENRILLINLPTGTSTYPNLTISMGLDNIVKDKNTGKLAPNFVPWPGFSTYYSGNIIENGAINWFRSDENGYLFRMNQLDGDGAEITSYATSATSTTITDSTQTWVADEYAGLTVTIIEGKGSGQTRTISSNTTTQLTVSSSWSTTPNTSSKFSIGSFPYYYKHSWNDYGQTDLTKRLRYLRPRFLVQGSFPITIYEGYDFTVGDVDEYDYQTTTGATWDESVWDDAIWDGREVQQNLIEMQSGRLHKWHTVKISNNLSGQSVIYNGIDKIFMMKGFLT